MPVFTVDTLQRFFNQAEQNLSTEKPYLVDRISVALAIGQAFYQLPDYVLSIKRVTYLGMALDPLPQREFREVFQSATQKGRPFWYVYNNVGETKIELFPAPPVVVPVMVNPWTTGIPTGFVVEFYRATDNVTFIAPPYIRRRLLKQFTASHCFAQDGSGQNLKLSAYFDKKWESWQGLFYKHIRDMYSTPRKVIVSEIVSNRQFPAPPILPIDRFGTSVTEGS